MAQFIKNPILLLFIAVCLFASLSRYFIVHTFRKHLPKRIHRAQPLSYYAQDMLSLFEATGIQIKVGTRPFVDKFDPKRSALTISSGGSSLCAVSVLLHECAHAVQFCRHKTLHRILHSVRSVVNSSAWLTIPLFLLALILNRVSFALFAAAIFEAIFIFHVLGFFVDLNANSYAKQAAKEHGYIVSEDTKPFLSILFASSLASFASIFQVLSAVLHFLKRLIIGPEKRTQNGET